MVPPQIVHPEDEQISPTKKVLSSAIEVETYAGKINGNGIRRRPSPLSLSPPFLLDQSNAIVWADYTFAEPYDACIVLYPEYRQR